MKENCIIITTRESPLALCQTEWVKKQLSSLYPTLKIELLGVTTQADKLLSISLSKVGGKGLFVKELEQALLEHNADMAVHSMKDMPMDYPPGLIVPVICEREDVRDVFVSNQFESLEDLPIGARIGTSSLRRKSQLHALRPDLMIEDLRGNVNTRLKRLDEGKFDALILAAAGLKRLGLGERITSYLSVEQMLPAVGQGALALECRQNDILLQEKIQTLNHNDTYWCVSAERAMCKKLNGGCQVPIAAFAEINNGELYLRGLVGSVDGKNIIRAEQRGSVNDAIAIGINVADALLQQGAANILQEFVK